MYINTVNGRGRCGIYLGWRCFGPLRAAIMDVNQAIMVGASVRSRDGHIWTRVEGDVEWVKNYCVDVKVKSS